MNFSEMSMHDIFRIEVENQSAILSHGLLNIENDNKSGKLLEKLMRASHSIKGAARIVGIDEIVNIAHLMEDCFVSAQQGELLIDSVHVDVLLGAVDAIVVISKQDEDVVSGYLISHKNEYQALLNNLKKILENSEELVNQFASEQELRVVNNHQEELLPKKITGKSKKNSKVVKSDGIKKPLTRVAEKRIVRVDAECMSRLLGLSGELTVESRWLNPFSRSLGLLKREYYEISDILERLRDSLLQRNLMTNADNLQFSAAQLKLSECRNRLTSKLQDLDDFDARNTSLSSQIFNELVASRMCPFSDATQGLQRTVRDLSRKLKKDVVLEFSGLDVLIDRDVIESIKSPLVHLIRNALDHGIESPEDRVKAGKASQAKIKLMASHKGGVLVITVSDDGCGVDLETLKSRILKRELVAEDILANLSETELLSFLYLPDFTTRDSVSELSGRGVGLDVVHDLVTALHGTIWADNAPGKGIRFIMQLPVTLSVMSAIVVKIAGENYAFPMTRIDRLESVFYKDLSAINGNQYVSINNQDILLVSGARILELDNSYIQQELVHIVIISDRDNTYGVVVDSYGGQRDLSVQSLDRRLGKIQDISAAALTRDGEAVLILDVDDLIRTILIYVTNSKSPHWVVSTDSDLQPHCKSILVVDDSLTVREVEKTLLSNSGYLVDVAVDGVDGWNALRRKKYDLLITDVDMPRMDGIELVNLVKQTAQLARLPVMIISYKDRIEDRQRGLDAGADYYLAKGSFQDETLLDAVIDLIGAATEPGHEQP